MQKTNLRRFVFLKEPSDSRVEDDQLQGFWFFFLNTGLLISKLQKRIKVVARVQKERNGCDIHLGG